VATINTIGGVSKIVHFAYNVEIFERGIADRGRRDRHRMGIEFTTTYAISIYPHLYCKFESRSGRGVQHYVIKLVVSDLRQVGGFLRFPPPIKLTATI